MGDGDASIKRAALNRLLAGVLGVSATTIVGVAGVAAVYYPLRHAGYGFQWLLVFLLMVAESAAIHLPSEVILPVGGWLVVRNHHLGLAGVIELSAIAAAANTVGSAALYAAGITGGRPLVRRYGNWFLLHERDVDAAERRMGGHQAVALFVSRLLPVVRTYVGFAAGVLRVPFATFAAATFAGSFVWCFAFVGAGALLGAHWSTLRTPMEVVGVAVLGLIVAGIAALTIMQFRAPRTT